jgi:DNA-binding Xre family transcriptional regulator
MPVMNRLQSVLREKGIQNANQLKVATKKADPENRGISQSTSLQAWKDPFWVPSASTLYLLCQAFDIQPGDFLFYVPAEKTNYEILPSGESRPMPKIPRLDVAIEMAKHLGITLEDLARTVGLNP